MKAVIFCFETLTDLGNLLIQFLFEICRFFVATAFFVLCAFQVICFMWE